MPHVRSTHTEIIESKSNKTEVQWSKVYYDFMPDEKESSYIGLYSGRGSHTIDNDILGTPVFTRYTYLCQVELLNTMKSPYKQAYYLSQ